MDFKDYLNKKPKVVRLNNPSPSVSNIQEDEEMTQDQFKILIKEIQLLRQDINKMNEGVSSQPVQTQPSMFHGNQVAQSQNYQQTTTPAPTMVKNDMGFTTGGSPKEIAMRAASILG